MAMLVSRRGFCRASCAALAAFATGSTLAACSSGTSDEDALGERKTSGEVIVAMSTDSEPDAGFDPFYGWACGEHASEPLVQSTLVKTDAELAIENDLATGYECSADALTWTFDLRDDVLFTDGTQLTAADAAFTLNGIKAFEGAELDLSFMEQAEATSDTRLVITLNKPYNVLLYTLASIGIVPQASYDAASYGANPIGSGRYVLEQWDKGQQAIFAANPNYYGEEPAMQRVVVVFMEEDAALAAAQAGEVDVAYTSATLADEVPSGYELLSCETVDCRGISLPTQEPGASKDDAGSSYASGNAATAHVELRRAMNYALDRDTMVANVLGGHGSAAYSVCDGLAWASDDMVIEHDADYAASLLTEAGWQLGDDGIYVLDGQRAAFDLYYPASDSVRQALAAEFADQMAAFGIEVTMKGSSWSTDADGIYAHEYSDPVLWGWGANSPQQLYTLLYGSSSGNYADYASEAVDAYLDAALATGTLEESYGLWQQAQWDGTAGIAPQGASTWVWLVNVDHLYFVREGLGVAEQKPHPHGQGWAILNDVDTWSWQA